MEKTLACTGFWPGQDFQDPDFDMLDKVSTGQHVLMEFLHGWCTLFAMALGEVTGLPIYCLADQEELYDTGCFDPANDDFPLVHAFCVAGDLEDEENPPFFVDCRGMINSKQAFLEEFRDFFTEYRLFRYTAEQLQAVKRDIWSRFLGHEAATQYYTEALNYIKEHIQDYTVNLETHKEGENT